MLLLLKKNSISYRTPYYNHYLQIGRRQKVSLYTGEKGEKRSKGKKGKRIRKREGEAKERIEDEDDDEEVEAV